MAVQIFKFNLSADAKQLNDNILPQIHRGDIIELNIDGHRLYGGAKSATILGSVESYLTQSQKLELSNFEQLPNGSCLLSYTVCY